MKRGQVGQCRHYFSMSLLILQYVVYFSGDLKIPSHISILHVEQEVVGDETEAVDSVLECDFERHELLQKEKALTQMLNLRYLI